MNKKEQGMKVNADREGRRKREKEAKNQHELNIIHVE